MTREAQMTSNDSEAKWHKWTLKHWPQNFGNSKQRTL